MVRSEYQQKGHAHFASEVFRRCRVSAFSLSPTEASFKRRGFEIRSPQRQQHFERIGETFIAGFNAAIALDAGSSIIPFLETTEREDRGFAYEGAAMGLLLLDGLLPGSDGRFRWLVREAGPRHMYMLSVGAGWALARLPWLTRRIDQVFEEVEPIVGFLSMDGAGFHNGYFSWKVSGERQRLPSRFRNYERRAFDQGLGRSMWFVCCGDIERVASEIGRFAVLRRADLWSGVGLAVTYAGTAEEADLQRLLWLARGYWGVVAQGAAFAAKARARAGLMVPHTERACRALCGMSAQEAADLTDGVLRALPRQDKAAYEIWRNGTQDAFERLHPASWSAAMASATSVGMTI